MPPGLHASRITKQWVRLRRDTELNLASRSTKQWECIRIMAIVKTLQVEAQGSGSALISVGVCTYTSRNATCVWLLLMRLSTPHRPYHDALKAVITPRQT